MSRIAVHHWQERIAPVFDIGGGLLVVDEDSGCREQCRMSLSLPALRAGELLALDVGTLICGAISRPMHAALQECGIRVVGFVAGDVDGVLAAWETGSLDEAFAMPGCRGRGCVRNHHARRRGLCQEETEQGHAGSGSRQDVEPGCARTRIRQRAGTAGDLDRDAAVDSAGE